MRILFLALLLAGFTAFAGAPAFQTNTVNLASGLLTLSNTNVVSTASTPFAVPQGAPFILQPAFSAAGVGNSNVVFSFNVSGDGTHYSTTLPFSVTIAANGTTNVVGYTNVPASVLSGVQWIRCDQIQTTQTNLVTITAIYASWFQ